LEIFFLAQGLSEDQPGLFGWVPAPPRGQGRPPFLWTREKSNRIMVLFAAGYSEGDVAAVIGCDAKTLRKVFPVECRDRKRAALVIRTGMMTRLLEEAEKGNVAATKELDRLLEAEKARAVDARLGGRVPTAGDKSAAKGKKEVQREEADNVVGLFGTRPPPPGAQLKG
jgi:hypothetical protein